MRLPNKTALTDIDNQPVAASEGAQPGHQNLDWGSGVARTFRQGVRNYVAFLPIHRCSVNPAIKQRHDMKL